VPRASAARELAYAKLLTARFAQAAPEVVFSSAASAEDHELSPSALILDYPQRARPVIAPTWARAMACSAKLESIADERAPSLLPGSVAPGGSRIIATQSDCPFQAVARHRLGAQPWPLRRAGLSAQERGSLLHEALAEFWRPVPDRTALLAFSAPTLAARIEAAVARALSKLPRPRWRCVPSIVRAGEVNRLSAMLAVWLAQESMRPPFAVRGVEVKQTLQLAGITFRLRLDRVDALDTGGLAILDYKSGDVERPGQWFDERPRASQLGLYTLAQRAADPDLAVRAAAYAQLKAGSVRVTGLAASSEDWPGLDLVTATGLFRDWPALESWWRTRLGALATEFAHGHAAVSPRRSPSPCRACGLYAVCRIQTVEHPQDDDAADE